MAAAPIDKMSRLKDYQQRADDAMKKAAAAATDHEREQWMQVAEAWSALIETIWRSQQNR